MGSKMRTAAVAAMSALLAVPVLAMGGCASGIQQSQPSSSASGKVSSNSLFVEPDGGNKPGNAAEIRHVASYDEPLGDNAIWCAPMELCWNEAMDVNGGPLGNADNDTKRSLNGQPFVKDYIGADHYYNYVDVVVSPQQTANEINTALKEKFGQESELLDGTQGNPGALFFYSMLYRKFSYAEPFLKLGSSSFGSPAGDGALEDAEYFGCGADDGTSAMRDQVTVLYYDDDENHAVMLDTREGDRVVFVKAPADGSAREMFEAAMTKAEGYSGMRGMAMEEPFKAPNMDIDVTEDFSGRLRGASLAFRGEEQVVDEAKQKTKLKMDNEGGEIKSEAYMTMKATAVPDPREHRRFLYDGEYAVFVLDGNAQVNADALAKGEYSQMKPYLAARIASAAAFQGK